ncbi:hypothetical protein [Methanoculleus chikugoensis]|uniref:hypothetical protein n=1 Tax=Methanoculleus chikugoensis TaxID=118126 RepID=UPI000B039D11|nr:hypothetical protein [Methanoculleus chikugoensis]
MESVDAGLPFPSPEEDETVPEVLRPVTDEMNEQPESSPVQAQQSAGIRSLIETAAMSDDSAESHASAEKDPVRALLERIGRSSPDGAEEVVSAPTVETDDLPTGPEMPADPPAAVEKLAAKPDAPASSPPGYHAPAGILERVKGWREGDKSGTTQSKPRVAEAVDDPGIEEEISDGVVTVEELGNLADLILPKSATFTIDELSINRGGENRFDFVDNARVVSEFDDIFSQSFSSTSLAAAAAQVVTPVEEVPQPPRFGFLKKLQVPKVGVAVEEYNATLHGPLVDLAMRPSPGGLRRSNSTR